MHSAAVVGPAGHNGEAVAWEAHIGWGCEGAKGRARHKKKARRMVDVPSNRTFGNCLLGLHCSQKDRAGTRASARFAAVAGCQQRNVFNRLYTRLHGHPASPRMGF